MAVWIFSAAALGVLATAGWQVASGNHPSQSSFQSTKQKRIETLIGALDTVNGAIISNPGGADFMMDPTCSALAAEGDDAVPALIDVIENDHRLTKVQSISRTFNGPSHFIPVRSAAWQILLSIWPSAVATAQAGIVPVPPPPPAAALRVAWAKDSKLTEPERFLNVLEDDSADWRFWDQAAGYLVKPANEKWIGGGFMRSGKSTGPMTAEPLRARRGQEILDALSKRALGLSTRKDGNSMDAFYCGEALHIAHDAYKWDPGHAGGVLKQTSDNCVNNLTELARSADLGQTLADSFGLVIADRIALHDPSAAKDYSAIIPLVHFTFGYPAGFLKPLWSAPHDADLKTPGADIVNVLRNQVDSSDPGQAFGALGRISQEISFSPILDYRPYRDLMIASLKNDRVLGEGEVTERGQQRRLAYRFDSGAQGSIGLPEVAPNIQAGQKVPLVLSDVMSQYLSSGFLKGFPAFSIAGSEGERKKQKARLIAFLSNDKFDWIAFSKKSPFAAQAE